MAGTETLEEKTLKSFLYAQPYSFFLKLGDDRKCCFLFCSVQRRYKNQNYCNKNINITRSERQLPASPMLYNAPFLPRLLLRKVFLLLQRGEAKHVN